MPEMDGIEATRLIRSQISSQSQPFIIAVTANAMQGDREQCLSAGMDYYISKPIDIEELIEGLSRRQAPPSLTSPIPSDANRQGEQAEPTSPLIFDPDAIERLKRALGREARQIMPGLIMDYIRDGDELQEKSRELRKAGDTKGLCLAAHTLKSNSATFGATLHASLCLKLEREARSGSMEQLIERIGAEWLKIKLALEKDPQELFHWPE